MEERERRTVNQGWSPRTLWIGIWPITLLGNVLGATVTFIYIFGNISVCFNADNYFNRVT